MDKKNQTSDTSPVNSQTGLTTKQKINYLQKHLGNEHSLEKIFEGEPSIKRIEMLHGKEISDILLLQKMEVLFAIIGFEVNEHQSSRIFEEIKRVYYYFTLSDFNTLLKHIEQKKIYGKLDYLTFWEIFSEYDHNRWLRAEEHSISTKNKDVSSMIHPKIVDAFKDVIGNIPKKTTKEQMRDAQLRYIQEQNKNN